MTISKKHSGTPTQQANTLYDKFPDTCYTVGELIALLKQFPENATVVVGGDGAGAPSFDGCFDTAGHWCAPSATANLHLMFEDGDR